MQLTQAGRPAVRTTTFSPTPTPATGKPCTTSSGCWKRDGVAPAGEFLQAALSRPDGAVDADLVKELAHLLFRIAEGNGWTKDALEFQHLGYESGRRSLMSPAPRAQSTDAQGCFDFTRRTTDDGFSDADVRAGRVPLVDATRARSSYPTSSAVTSGRTSASVNCWSRSCAGIRSGAVMLLKTGNDSGAVQAAADRGGRPHTGYRRRSSCFSTGSSGSPP